MPEHLVWLFAGLFRTIHRRNLLRRELLALTPSEFEERVRLLLEDLGWINLRLRGGSGDRGVDLEGEFQGTRYVIQCKRYHHNKSVSPSAVRDLVGALHIQKADRALLVTTSSFTSQGYAEARDQAVELWDGNTLTRKIEEAAALRADPSRQKTVWRRRFAVLAALAAFNVSCSLFAFISEGAPVLATPAGRERTAPSPGSITGTIMESLTESIIRSIFPASSPTPANANANQQPTAIPPLKPTPTEHVAPTVILSPEPMPTERAVPTTTVSNGGNVRAAPNMRGTVLDQVHAGEIVELLGRSADGNWLCIRNPRGQVGWTHRTLLSLATGVDERLEVVTP